ncbi:MAG: hypothetical protein LUG19_02095, partial [Desulfovibrio sp.]|uniref:hypothetical protein n=1 Tax=Desulfovibrio sp. TaxID=885 RepID=UPI002587001E
VYGPQVAEMRMSDRTCACKGAAGKKALQAHMKPPRPSRGGSFRIFLFEIVWGGTSSDLRCFFGAEVDPR